MITDKDNVSKIHEISEHLPYLKLVMVVDGGWDEAVIDPKENPLRPTRFAEGLAKKGKTLMSH